ncbi:MAG TPA: hypothetical protein VFK16_01490 [Gemmatimonadaceae bacterium]|jgi:polyhydroxyalkanoate synthesis regulator phasin|nr:hypothetical protein [Gemmatimonadaceae bacterium]
MPDSVQSGPAGGDAAPQAGAPRRGPGHRADARDTLAELTEKAQQISREAGSQVAAAMKDVISAGAGIAGFAIESARDLTAFMVRRGQMTQDEADKLLREAEAAHSRRSPSERSRPTATRIAADKAALVRAQAAHAAELAAAAFAKLHPPRKPKPPSKVFMPHDAKPAKAAKKSATAKSSHKKTGKPAASKAAGKTAHKKSTAAKSTSKKPAAKKSGHKTATKSASKSAGKSSARKR